MRELLSQVAAVDLAAAEGLRLVTHFDALVENRAPLEGLIRSAAAVALTPVGVSSPYRRVGFRVDGTGRRTAVDRPVAELRSAWPHHDLPDEGVVWLERATGTSGRDQLLLERLALAVQLTFERLGGGLPDHATAVSLLLDPGTASSARSRAARALGLDPAEPARAMLAPPGRRGATLPSASAVVDTAAGPVLATVRRAGDRMPTTGPAGIGVSVPVAALPSSIRGAIAALQLTTAGEPLVHAEQLGPLVALDVTDPLDPALRTAAAAVGVVAGEQWGLPTARALASTDSVRAAAALCTVHHSTMQARCGRISAAMGYDVRTPSGRFRLGLDLAAHALVTVRFTWSDTG